MNEIARKLDFSLRRLVSALIIIYFLRHLLLRRMRQVQ